MARRSGGDKIHNKNKELNSSLKRELRNKNKVPDIIIACEDAISSPSYFKKIISILVKDKKITQDSFVIASHKHTNPTGVLEDLMNHSDINNKTYQDFKHKWIVIDRDTQIRGGGHMPKDFNNALEEAKNNNIKVAYSNDSFEIWYLLHFHYINTPISRTNIIDKIIPLLIELNSSKLSNLNKTNIKQELYVNEIFDILLGKQKTAIKNAKKLLKSHDSNHNPEQDNPSTTIHLLVELLNGF